MQSYYSIPSTETLTNSRQQLLNNDLTVMSQSSGTVFPTANLQIGMPCHRTDQNKLYVLKDLTPTWVVIADLTKTYTSQEYVDAADALKISRVSANRPGVTKLYRNDNDSAYNVQVLFDGTYWQLQGYATDTYHAGCRVSYADLAGKANSLSTGSTIDGATGWSYIRFQHNGANIWDVGSTNGGGLEFLPSGSPTGSVVFQTDGDIDLSRNAGKGVWFKDETTPNIWNVHAHGDRMRMYNGTTEYIIATTGDIPSSFSLANALTVTASTQAALSAGGSVGTGNVVGSVAYTLNQSTGIAAGTYTLQNIIQSLVNLSHVHARVGITSYVNCNCSTDSE